MKITLFPFLLLILALASSVAAEATSLRGLLPAADAPTDAPTYYDPRYDNGPPPAHWTWNWLEYIQSTIRGNDRHTIHAMAPPENNHRMDDPFGGKKREEKEKSIVEEIDGTHRK